MSLLHMADFSFRSSLANIHVITVEARDTRGRRSRISTHYAPRSTLALSLFERKNKSTDFKARKRIKAVQNSVKTA